MVKKDRARKLKKPPVKKLRKRITGLVILDGKRQIDRRTGLNRDIPPMGGAGGSPNLLQALATRPAITGQGGFSIQTPDQFKQAQDISTIAEEVKKQRISIGEPTKLTGKVLDLTDVEEQKKAFTKPEPVKMQRPNKEPPLRKQVEKMQEIKTKRDIVSNDLRSQLREKYSPARPPIPARPPTPATPLQEWLGAKSAGGAPRQWVGGGHVAGLAPASAPSSIVGNADAMGAPQPDTY